MTTKRLRLDRENYVLTASVIEVRLDFNDGSLIYYDRSNHRFSANKLTNLAEFVDDGKPGETWAFLTFYGDRIYQLENETSIKLDLNDEKRSEISFLNNGHIVTAYASPDFQTVGQEANSIQEYEEEVVTKTTSIRGRFYQGTHKQKIKSKISYVPINGELSSKFKMITPSARLAIYGGAIFNENFVTYNNRDEFLLSTNMLKEYVTLDTTFS